LFVEYEAIARVFPWTLTEVKGLNRRERQYWFRVSQDVRTSGTTDEEGMPV
jgi:hypothetical protein